MHISVDIIAAKCNWSGFNWKCYLLLQSPEKKLEENYVFCQGCCFVFFVNQLISHISIVGVAVREEQWRVIFTSNTENPMWRFWTRRLFLLSGFCMRDTSMFFSPCSVEHLLSNSSILKQYCGLVQKLSAMQRGRQFIIITFFCSPVNEEKKTSFM